MAFASLGTLLWSIGRYRPQSKRANGILVLTLAAWFAQPLVSYALYVGTQLPYTSLTGGSLSPDVVASVATLLTNLNLFRYYAIGLISSLVILLQITALWHVANATFSKRLGVESAALIALSSGLYFVMFYFIRPVTTIAYATGSSSTIFFQNPWGPTFQNLPTSPYEPLFVYLAYGLMVIDLIAIAYAVFRSREWGATPSVAGSRTDASR